jgi:hypothetical protein
LLITTATTPTIILINKEITEFSKTPTLGALLTLHGIAKNKNNIAIPTNKFVK